MYYVLCIVCVCVRCVWCVVCGVCNMCCVCVQLIVCGVPCAGVLVCWCTGVPVCCVLCAVCCVLWQVLCALSSLHAVGVVHVYIRPQVLPASALKVNQMVPIASHALWERLKVNTKRVKIWISLFLLGVSLVLQATGATSSALTCQPSAKRAKQVGI